MFKVAAPDPVQLKLRQNKKLWNKEVSTFINDLINFKKTMNGAPSKFHMEKGTIKEPIPADPATIIGVLADDFRQIAEKGNAIIDEQISYSKTRRKSQPKAPAAPATPEVAPPAPAAPGPPDLSKQLAAFEQKYDLVAEGSSKVSRFFTRLFNPTIGFGKGADLRRARMSMLNACADAYKDLGKFQVQVVKSSRESVEESNKKLHEAWNKWTLVSRAYVIYKNSKSVNAPDKGGTIESEIEQQDLKEEKALESLDKSVKNFEEQSKGALIVPSDEAVEQAGEQTEEAGFTGMSLDTSTWPLSKLEKVKSLLGDYRRYRTQLSSNIDDSGYLMELDRATDKFIATKGKMVDPDYEQFYSKALMYINQKNGTTAASFRDLASQLKAKKPAPAPATVTTPAPVPVVSPPANEENEKTASAQIEKVAQDFLKKWVGKTMHQLSLFDKTSPYRLNCYKLAGEIRKELNKTMDLLEKGLDEKQLDPLIRGVNGKLVSLRGMMRSLHLAVPPEKKPAPLRKAV